MLTLAHFILELLYVAALGLLLVCCVVGCVVCLQIAWVNRRKPVDPEHRSSRHD